MPELDVAKEHADLESVWGRLPRVRISVLERADPESLRREVLRRDYHVLHFMGHGAFSPQDGEGVLYFENEDGAAWPVSGRALAAELKDAKSLRLVVLNACETGNAVSATGGSPYAGVASALVLGGIPAVVAMQAPIADAAAIAFSRAFYERLAAGEPVDAAVAEGRLAIHRLDEKAVEWAKPLLFLRSPDGRIFTRSIRWYRGRFAAGLVLALLSAAAAGSGWWMQDDRHQETLRRSSDAQRLHEQGLIWAQRSEQEESERRRVALDRASAAFHEALRLDPDLVNACCSLARVELAQGRDAAAIERCLRAVERKSHDPILHYEMGMLYLQTHHLPEARKHLLKAVDLDPRYAAAHDALGDLFLELRDAEAARQHLARALAVLPGSAPILKDRARAALVEGEYKEAIADLMHALQLQPEPVVEREIRYHLAEAHAMSGETDEACSSLEMLARVGISDQNWGRKGAELSRKLGCSASGTQRAGTSHPLTPISRAESLRASVADFGGTVYIAGAPEGEAEELRIVYRTLVIPAGHTVRLADGAWANVVCSNNQLVHLARRRTWTLTPDACQEGRPLGPGAYASVAPEIGRLRSLAGRPSVLEQRIRSEEKDEPGIPKLLYPRNTAVREARPEIVWSGVEEAFEYEIELVGSRLEPVRIAADGIACAAASDFPMFPRVCRAAYPESFPDLRPGAKELLRVGVRATLVAGLMVATEGSSVTRLTDPETAEVRRALEEIDASPAGPWARQLLRAGVLARADLRGDAIEALQKALVAEDHPALRVTLGDLFLEIGLAGQARASYEAALRSEPNTVVRAAAELGLGLAADAQRESVRAQEHLRRARSLYAEAGLDEEAALASHLASQAGGDEP